MLKLIKNYWKELLFGLSCNFFSGPGQTFLVSLFNPHLRESLDLSKSELSFYYSIATLGSALLLPFWGRLIDRISLLKLVPLFSILFTTGLFFLSYTQNIILLTVGFFLIRNLGQGSLTLTSSTVTAKYFHEYRGKALSIINLGFPLSEAIFPTLVTFIISIYGYQTGFFSLGLSILMIYLPLSFFLIKNSQYRNQTSINEKENKSSSQDHQEISISPILKSFKFWSLNIVSLMPAATLTGLFFHQHSFIEWKKWPIELVAQAFVIYAICRALCSFIIGPMIDRFSAKRLFPFVLIPLSIGILFLIYAQPDHYAYFYLCGLGICIGLSGPIKSALFAEIYGVKQLGSIKGILSSTTVISTAITPIIYGYLLDRNFSIFNLLWMTIVILLISTIIAFLVCRKSIRTETS